ncbi:MAG: hypothetical protein WD598_13105 [Acidimicrobiia bacterium]
MRSRVLRRAVAATAVALAIFTSATAIAPAPVAHAASSRAVIVIGNDSPRTISFSGTINGLQALQMVASVETIGYSGQGTAVCKINGVGNPAVPGECLGETTGKYWSYWKSPPGSSSWQYAGSAAGSSPVSNGSVEGWAYGTGQPPPYHSFCDTAGCASPPPAPTSPSNPSGFSGVGATTETSPDGTPAPAGTEVTTTSTRSPNNNGASSEQTSGPKRGGRPNIQAGDDGNSPVGVIVAGGLVVALGGAGLWFRRHRRLV